MISTVHFKNFKALRSAAVRLTPFNLVIGPNGSGKTSLIEALQRLRTLAGLPAVHGQQLPGRKSAGPQIEFHFSPPFQDVRVTLGCSADEFVCNLLVVDHPPGIAGEGQWAELRTQLQGIRAFRFDHAAMAGPGAKTAKTELAADGGNLAAVLAARRESAPEAFTHLEADFCRILPEFAGLDFRPVSAEASQLFARLKDGDEALPAGNLSEGTLYLLAILCLAHDPAPPEIVCLEEADRGVHPRMLREVRDALYRLSYPLEGSRAPVQVVTTTHSPYLLDLFKDHPEEVVLANKLGNTANFERLSERADLLELLKEANLGDLWYSGILGGVPQDT